MAAFDDDSTQANARKLTILRKQELICTYRLQNETNLSEFARRYGISRPSVASIIQQEQKIMSVHPLLAGEFGELRPRVSGGYFHCTSSRSDDLYFRALRQRTLSKSLKGRRGQK